MSHAWQIDSCGRSTHDRVHTLHVELQKLGWKVWFDEEKLFAGDILDVKLADGISSSDAVCICITRAYCEKVNSGNIRDNVFKEWNFCQTIGKKMIPIILEPEMRDVKAWPVGVMTMILGNTFYLDASGDNLVEVAARLGVMLRALGLKPRLTSHSLSWPMQHISNRDSVHRRMTRVRTEIRI